MRLRPALVLPLALALVGCIVQAPPATAPTPTAAVSPAASPARSPSPSPSPTVRPSPSWDPAQQRPFTVSGRADLALEGPYRLVAGERTFRCVYEGRALLTVWLIREDGRKDAELFNREGPFSEAVTHPIGITGGYHLQITGANGAWRVEIR